MKHHLLAGMIALACSSAPAFAYDYTYTEEEHGISSFESLYAGAGVGMIFGDARDKCVDMIDCVTWKGFVGYRPSADFALEAGFHSILDARVDSSGDDMNTSALSLSMLGITSAKDWAMLDNYLGYLDFVPGYRDIELFGKVGAAVWDSRVNNAVAVSGTDFLLGVGAQVKLDENIGLRSEMEYFGGDVDSVNVDASLTYSTF